MNKKISFAGLILIVALLFQVLPAPRPATAVATCDWAQFVADVTVPDGTIFKPGASFTKTWRMKNIGSCTWTTAYSLVFYAGDQLGAPVAIPLQSEVAPGATIDLSVAMMAGNLLGSYRSDWLLKNAAGSLFGIGSTANKSFWVSIMVSASGSEIGVAYDFAANAGSAKWLSGAGTLPFPGTDGSTSGFAIKSDSVQMETGVTDNRPALLTVPQNKTDGYIQALFPALTIQNGDHFQATIGCQYGATACYVTYRVDYRTSTGTRTLWTFRERYDGMTYNVNLDLSALAGKSTEFFLLVLASGSATGDRAVWIAPRITRAGATPPTPTAISTLPTPPTSTVPTLTPVPAGCTDHAVFVADVNVPDGTVFSPNAAFTKTWRIKNIGTCTWTTAYKLVFVSGDKMGGPDSANLTSTIGPNTTADFSINLTAPAATGTYRGYWQFKNAAGTAFGIGSTWDKPFWVDIVVTSGVTPVPTTAVPPTPDNSGVAYDFVAKAGSAKWQSGAGALTFPGTDGSASGFALKFDGIQMETGVTDSRPALLTVPQNKTDGYIQALFPALTIQGGDHFQATIGCQYGATACYVTYRVDYRTSTGTRTLWTFRERYDGLTYNVNLDLSALAGKSTEFFLMILASGPATGDRAVWIAPRIIRGGAASPTPTSTFPPIVSSPDIRQLSMLDASNGWALTASYLLRTTNGGVTWYNVTPLGVTSVGSNFFQNASKGWVIGNVPDTGNVLFRTTNGGQTWVSYKDLPFSGGSMQFLDDTHGFVLSGEPVGMQKQPVDLYQTSNGGATWVRNFTNNPLDPAANDSLPFGGHKSGITFRDTSTGWVGGDIPTTGFFYFYKTTNSGVTWTHQQLPIPAGYDPPYIVTSTPTFFGTSNAVVPAWLGTSIGSDLFLYTTHNGGATWTASSSFARNGRNVDIISLTEAIAWNEAGYFMVTHNAGASWTQVTPNVSFGDNVPNMHFVSPTLGWVTVLDFWSGGTTLYRTTDGGANWTMLFTTVPPTPTLTPVPPTPAVADVQSVEIQILETSPLQANAIVHGQLPDNGCTKIWRVDQTRDGSTFRLTLQTLTDSLAQCNNTPTPYQQVVALDVGNLPPASYLVNANGVEKSFKLVTQDFTKFGQVLVDALNARNFDTVKVLMDQSFVFGYWLSQATFYTADLAIDALRTNNLSATTPLTADPGKDLIVLLDGLDPYSIAGLDAAKSQALFVSGWGLDGKDEAILYSTRLPDGSLYWYGVLIAPGGFVQNTPTPTATAGP